MKRFNLHSHSLFCDGKNSMEEMALAAIEKGLYCFGFSAHAPIPYDNDFALKYEEQDAYLQEARRLKEKYADRLKEASLDWHLEETQEEFVIMDKAGRVQIPREMLQQMGLTDNKVRLEYQDGRIVISGPDQKES